MTKCLVGPARVGFLIGVVVLAACGGSAGLDAPGGVVGGGWKNYERGETHPGVVEITGLRIPLRDGVELSANVLLPASADGVLDSGPYPVILTQTGYNKSVPLLRSSNTYFVHRGYAHVSVDVRGTGQSAGIWEAFSDVEQADYREVMDWVATQPWSDGRIGTWGASFAAITQLFTAAHQHPAHKAIFAIVPMGDAYRDIVFTGGQINAGFIPLWMGLVTSLGLIPAEPNADSVAILTQHVTGALTGFQVPTLVQSALGVGGRNFDGPFWRTRSPLEVADRIRTPTFIVGGLNDLFQRGQPLLYEALKDQTTTKLLIGPWMHVDGSAGAGLPADGVPDLDQLALQWFDHYLLGVDNGAAEVPNVTQYVYGHGHYVTSSDWPHPQLGAERWFLHRDGTLASEPAAVEEAPRTTLQYALNGLCSMSTAQWTAGAIAGLPIPCIEDNRLNELVELTYTTPPMVSDYYVNGPIQADIWISTSARDSGLVVRITDVGPDGRSREITNGLLTASLRAQDATRARSIDGLAIQPWHPFTQASEQALPDDAPAHLAVEVFPSSFLIREGHRLRVSIGPSDFPHGVPPLLSSLDQMVGALSVHTGGAYASSVTLPVVPAEVLQ